ncbi:MAG: sugar transferase [Victivallales bacterium]|jgi:exopolysaccharide biosynthesis polyprenyl glycosylphosphotransferase
MKTHIQEKAALLLISDSVAMLSSFVFAIILGHRSPVTLGLLYGYRWGLVALLIPTLLIFFVSDGYTLNKVPQRFTHQALILGFGLLASSILSTGIFFFFRDPVPRAVFIIFYGSAFAFVVYFRKILNQRMLSSIQWRALIVGDGKRSSEVAQVISSRAYLRTKVVGYVSEGNGSPAQNRLPCLGSISEIVSIAKKEVIDQIIIAVPVESDDLNKLLLKCMQNKIQVSEFRRVIEEITGMVPIDHLNDNWFLHELSASNKRYFWYMKRAADIAVSCVGLCLALPLFPLIALLIKLDSRGPVFYSQQRMGRGSKPFWVWKLRTMADGADCNNIHWTLDNDDRITRVGRIVRKTRLDEVPQLLNIFKGEMSLIGPRPEALSLVEMYTRAISYYPERHMVTPGITGWAQINYRYGNSIEDTRQKLMYDFYYIKNRCMILDIMIFLRTIMIMLTGKGSM